jgi:hypothetical protein
MRHLDLEVEKLEQRIAPGMMTFGNNDSHSKSKNSKSKSNNSKSNNSKSNNSKSKSHNSKSKSKSYGY